MSKVFRKTVIIAALLGALLLIYFVRGILWPFLLSALLAYLLNPMVNYFELFGIKRMIVVVCLYITVLAATIGGLFLIAPGVVHQATTLNNNLPEYTEQVKGITLIWQWKLENRYPMIKQKDIINKAIHAAQSKLSYFLSKIPSYLMNIFSIFALLIIVPFATFFFIVDGRIAKEALYRNLPPRYIETVLSLVSEIDESIGRYIRYQMIEASIVGILSVIGLLILGVNYALLIGILAGLANLIPYFGPFVGMIFGIGIGFMQFKSLVIVAQIFILFILVQFIDNNFIQPVVISKGTNLHPMIIFFAVMAGAEILGVIGMFIAVPVAVTIKVTISVLLKNAAPGLTNGVKS